MTKKKNECHIIDPHVQVKKSFTAKTTFLSVWHHKVHFPQANQVSPYIFFSHSLSSFTQKRGIFDVKWVVDAIYVDFIKADLMYKLIL